MFSLARCSLGHHTLCIRRELMKLIVCRVKTDMFGWLLRYLSYV